MADTPQSDHSVAWVEEPQKSSRLMGLGAKRHRLAEAPAHIKRFIVKAAGTGLTLSDAAPNVATDLPWEEACAGVLWIDLRPHSMEIAVAKFWRDGDNHEWDITLNFDARVTDPLAFARTYNLPALLPSQPLTEPILEAYLASDLNVRIRQASERAEDKSIGLEESLPPKFWTHGFNEWLKPAGLEVVVKTVRPSSAQREQAEAEKLQAEHALRVREETARRQAEATAALSARAELDRKRAELEAQHDLGEHARSVRAHQLADELIELTEKSAQQRERHRLAMAEEQTQHDLRLNDLRVAVQREQARQDAELERENLVARQKAEMAVAALQAQKQQIAGDTQLHEAERVARYEQLDVDIKEADFKKKRLALRSTELEENALRRRKRLDELEAQRRQSVITAQEQKETNLEMLKTLKEMTEAIAALRASSQKPAEASTAPPANHQGLEWLVHVGGLHGNDLSLLGAGAARQVLVDRFTALDMGEVLVEKPQAITRDAFAVPVETIKVMTPLHITINSDRDGYVTLINIGTSGTIRRICPNHFVSPERATIKKGQTLHLPGDPLLPNDQLARNGLQFAEMGPTGWETLIALVSRFPLNLSTAPTRPRDPTTIVPVAALEQLLAHLASDPALAAVGVGSFMVVD